MPLSAPPPSAARRKRARTRESSSGAARRFGPTATSVHVHANNYTYINADNYVHCLARYAHGAGLMVALSRRERDKRDPGWRRFLPCPARRLTQARRSVHLAREAARMPGQLDVPLDAQQNGTGFGRGGGRGGRALLGAGRGGRGGRGRGAPPPPGAIFVKGQRGVTIVKPDAATKTGLTLGGVCVDM